MSNLDELLTAPTRDEALEALILFARMGDFPTSNWSPFGLPRQLFESESKFLSKLGEAIKAIASGGFNKLAEAGWLDLLSENFYLNKRKPAVFTEGRLTLRDIAGVGPTTKQSGTVWAASLDGTRRYKNLEAFTVPLNGVGLTIDGKLPLFQAESAGVAWNLGNGTITQLVTSLPGISVSNPADPDTGSWIVTRGDERESDPSLRQRNDDKWSTIGSGANEAAYRYWATTLVNEVRRVKVAESSIGDGRVYAYLAGTGGAASGAAVATVNAFLQVKVRPLCSRLLVSAAANREIPISGTIFVRLGYDLVKVLAKAQEALSIFFGAFDIGATIFKSALIDVLMEVEGVYNVALDDIAVSLGATEVAVPNLAYLTALR